MHALWTYEIFMHLRSTYELRFLNGSLAIRRFKHSNASEISDEITLDFYMELPHVDLGATVSILHKESIPACMYHYTIYCGRLVKLTPVSHQVFLLFTS